MSDVFVVVRLTDVAWDRIYRGYATVLYDDAVEAVLGADELRSLNLWDAAKEVQQNG